MNKWNKRNVGTVDNLDREPQTQVSPILPRAPAGLVGKPTFVIRPSKGWVPLNLRDLWGYRELLYFLIWRDIKVRYKQTVLGAAWAILQPFLTMIVFSVFFGRLAQVPSDGIPYPVFSYVALLPWQLFSHALTESADSLVSNRQLITKVYFPRLLIPLAAVLAGLIDFAIAFVVLLGMMFYFGIVPTLAVFALPFFLVLLIALAVGAGLWLSALNVKYRDVHYIIPFLVQFWLFASPVAYSSSIIPAPWRTWYGLNPIAGIVEGFRWALLRQTPDVGPLIMTSSLVIGVILVSGLVYFRRMERTFADVV